VACAAARFVTEFQPIVIGAISGAGSIRTGLAAGSGHIEATHFCLRVSAKKLSEDTGKSRKQAKLFHRDLQCGGSGETFLRINNWLQTLHCNKRSVHTANLGERCCSPNGIHTVW
jgi:hypothetical protein